MVDLKKATVLVVDDEPDLRQMVAYEFELQGSKVYSANDGRGALDIVESRKVDAVITDIRMAECNGIELLGSIRRSPAAARHASDPVVFFITAYDSDLSPFEAYHLGAAGIFPKPFSLKALVENVQRALAPPEERWCTPPSVRPLHTLTAEWDDLCAARKVRQVELGRGGIAVAVPGQAVMPGGLIGFTFTFAEGPVPIIEGAGAVRWIQHGVQTDLTKFGIEFDYLTEASRGPVLAWLNDNPCTPFIPRL